MRNLFFFFLFSSILFTIESESIKLVLVRNGESIWNQLNLFVGWTDVQLSEQGRKNAIDAGKLLKDGGYIFDVCYTSFLKRSIQTAIHLLDEIDQLYIPIIKTYHLNGRHYGALQGLNKQDALNKYGIKKIKSWKESYDYPPPILEEHDERNPANQKQYKNYPKENLPLHESLKDINNRVVPYYQEVIVPEILSGKKVLITAHSNSLKALIKHLEDISEQEILDLEIRSAACIFLARNGCSKEQIRDYVEEKYHYDLHKSMKEIVSRGHGQEICQISVPQAIICFLHSDSFIDTIRKAVSIGGDSDTLACIGGSIAEAYYGMEEEYKKEVYDRLSDDLKETVQAFEKR